MRGIGADLAGNWSGFGGFVRLGGDWRGFGGDLERGLGGGFGGDLVGI